MSKLLPVEEALDRILSAMPVLPSEVVPLPQALGRVTSTSILSRRTQPPVAMSAMDGYAVRAEDVQSVPATLRRVGSAPAGGAYEGEVGAGEAVRIFTGGPVPAGADAIVIQEDVDASSEEDGATITVNESVLSGTYIRPAGLDFKEGDEGIAAGKQLTPRDIGLLAAMNVPWVEVIRKPKVAILSTGDEIVRPGEPIGPNQIVSSNASSLAAIVEANGGIPIDLGISADDAESLRTLAAGAKGADLLVTTGGASVGDHDLVQSALGDSELGADALEVGFWRIAMRPGKPLIFGSLGGVPMLGLPGNPVSTMVCAMIFLLPALARMQRLSTVAATMIDLPLSVGMKPNDQRQDYVRATITKDEAGTPSVTPFSRQDSSMMSRLAAADGLIVRRPFDPAHETGDLVKVIDLSSCGFVV